MSFSALVDTGARLQDYYIPEARKAVETAFRDELQVLGYAF